ncbi:diguanylate cyclase [Zoogloea sp.]|uniref:GGDEF domain-containing protein n=1 Tax=Zoogloea sp. TaxID=49181 RepID=UPI0014157BC4|nr:MAG: diguanylate cyclase [Zoogloea sp.]
MTSSSPPGPVSRALIAHGVLIFFLLAAGGWLVFDFARERDRTVASVSRLAMHKSQLVSALFGDIFIAADYVLRDMADHAELALTRKTALVDLTPLLEKKLTSLPALTDLVLLDGDCRFAAVGSVKSFLGKQSRQRFCSATSHQPGQSLHVQYMPAEKSANGKPVVLISRVIATPQGHLQAAAMAVIELDFAQHWIEAFTVDAPDVMTIVDTEGVLIARNPPMPAELGRRTVAPPGQPPFEQIGSGNATTFTAHSPLDHSERIYGLSRLEHFPFIALVGYDMQHALEGWQQRARQFALGYAALALLSIGLLRAHLRTLAQSRAMHALATTDALTGIANRRHLFERGEHEVARALRYGKPLSILMIDIDLFKAINDRWGHPSGDQVIRNIADLMQGILRAVDTCGRLGGEEFLAILPETAEDGAGSLAERLRQAVEASEEARADNGQAIRHTVSIGVATLAPGDTSFEALLRRADLALYRAKASGRNRVTKS